jgi:hypothetical protein
MFKNLPFDLNLILSRSPHDANEDNGLVLVVGPDTPPHSHPMGLRAPAFMAFIEKMMTNPTVH